MQNFSHTIWMGDLEPYMDEMFIKRAFETSGENIVSVKVIRNKATGQTLGYGFIEFANSTSARDAMLKLNGKLIPGAPTRRFKLNHASYGKDSTSSNECSLFVGELTEDVDDLALFNAFKKYPTCRSAKVVMTNGKSRGYGFVRFLTESDMDKALIEMQNYCGLGYKPIRVSLAIPKRYNADGSLVVTTSASETSSVVPSGMPDPFTAAVAAAVTGNSAAQAEYYQAYQQYYQQYYASQYAAHFYSSESSTNGDIANSGITSIAGGGTLVGDATVQQHAFVDAAASHLYARALQQGTGSQEYAPEPHVLSSACDRPRHVDDLDEVFNFLEASRWNVTDPSLGLYIKIRP
ncbi:tRNA selenocysteine 1-associated protein isoform 1 [Schistosoma japonicum]|uniref:tRNA selenocysteine-associated protein 1 n=2 Tax=Schistosoma TaxID=6181 RepID=Q5DE20_SCHJA|nr:SJCHGC05387 protein [Schistosoma japonicum]KAK4474820.1 hypothetical protein MN116_000741 [Schistosoma mekongi]KAH8862776.1 tRNA selenocysteine 1-associated protein 1 [Schistosoma japonicum]KAH8862778.1 tRNA selenocysteine 1-associated protein 1 [Schistosoma japonicum]TNN12869.1 tRNA selenocysteine 1-associated protein isoform 1 [Schistosoma japonicum]